MSNSNLNSNSNCNSIPYPTVTQSGKNFTLSLNQIAKTLHINKTFALQEQKQKLKRTELIKQKEEIISKSPFKKYTSINQYKSLSPEKKVQFHKAHQYYINQIIIHRNLLKQNNTLCWLCSKAGCSKKNKMCCPWIKEGLPIKGWKAEQTIVNNINETINTYNILDCPHFKFDSSCRSYELTELFPLLAHFNKISERTIIRNPQKQIDKYNELFPYTPLQLYVDPYEGEYEEDNNNEKVML